MKKKVILIIAILILLILIVILGRNFYLVNKIMADIEKNTEITNYRLSYSNDTDPKNYTEMLTNGDKTVMKIYQNNNIISKVYIDESKNKINDTTYHYIFDVHILDEKNATVKNFQMHSADNMSEEVTNYMKEKGIEIFSQRETPNSNNFQTYNTKYLLTAGLYEQMSFGDKLKATLKWNISSEEVNNVKCYHVKKNENSNYSGINEFWVNKENGYKVKTGNENYTYYYDIELNTVTENDLSLPDLNAYTKI